jgi:predicted glutamine amidotransferase
MCLLTFLPANTLPDIDALYNGAYWNNDGHGFAIVNGREIIVRHGMDPVAVLREFETVRAEYSTGPALFHSRWGTHGTVGLDNCHPFMVGGDTRTVLAHNGVLTAREVQPGKKDPRCDTRIAAEDYLPREPFGPLTRHKSRKRLGQWLTRANKFVILTVDPRYRANAYVVNEQSGIWSDGIWYSNDAFSDRPYFGTATATATAGLTVMADDHVCATCLSSANIDPAAGMCRVCGTCADCDEPEGFCVCYNARGTVWTKDDQLIAEKLFD